MNELFDDEYLPSAEKSWLQKHANDYNGIESEDEDEDLYLTPEQIEEMKSIPIITLAEYFGMGNK